MITAKDLLTARVVEGKAEERLMDIAPQISAKQAQHCVVLSGAGHFLGMIGLANLAARSNAGHRILADLIGDAPIPLVDESATAREVALLFEQNGAREALVLSSDRIYRGLITTESLFAWMQSEQRAVRQELEDLLSERQRLNELLDRKVEQRTAEVRTALEEFKTASLALSHDVRGPLRTIQGYADILVNGEHGSLDAEGLGCAQSIKRSATRLELLADDILAKARRAFASNSPVSDAIDLNGVLDDALDFHRALFNERGAILRKRGVLHTVAGRYVPLLQILSNLVANAVLYSRPGQQPIVEVWTEATDGRIKLCVKDNGRGITAAEARRLFVPFERGASTDRAGSGLGLAIAKRAAEEPAAPSRWRAPGPTERSLRSAWSGCAQPAEQMEGTPSSVGEFSLKVNEEADQRGQGQAMPEHGA